MRGFSLLELVLVMAIVATVAAIALPRWGHAVARYRAEAAAHRIAADLGLARATARADSHSVTVTFNVAGNSYGMDGVESLQGAPGSASVSLSDEPYRSTLLAAAFGGDPVVVFDGWGVADSGGTVTISCGSVTRTVQLDPGTGVAIME